MKSYLWRCLGIVAISNLWIAYVSTFLVPLPLWLKIACPFGLALVLVYGVLSLLYYDTFNLRHWVHPDDNITLPAADVLDKTARQWCRENCRGRWRVITGTKWIVDTPTGPAVAWEDAGPMVRMMVFSRASDAALFLLFRASLCHDP